MRRLWGLLGWQNIFSPYVLNDCTINYTFVQWVQVQICQIVPLIMVRQSYEPLPCCIRDLCVWGHSRRGWGPLCNAPSAMTSPSSDITPPAWSTLRENSLQMMLSKGAHPHGSPACQVSSVDRCCCFTAALKWCSHSAPHIACLNARRVMQAGAATTWKHLVLPNSVCLCRSPERQVSTVAGCCWCLTASFKWCF